MTNPYADALDGLTIEDPVRAFFDFCRERESIRAARERGEAAPWSDDPIFQRGRFLNVFREDDRGSKALFRFVEGANEGTNESGELPLAELVQALFFARWCNRQSTLDALHFTQLRDPLRLQQTLLTTPEQPWCNVTAYPVEPVRWEGRSYGRLEAATALFADIKERLAELILSAGGDVVRATAAINERFQMRNDFPIFMAVMDVAWFRPDVIDPASPVPTGIGASPYLDRLQRHLGCADHHEACAQMIALQPSYWPEAKRALQPIDVEYLSCECRKYYSYVNGTKTFEGKNRFKAGQSPRLPMDVEVASAEQRQTQICVIAGGPCSGKTTLSRALRERGHRVEPETAERLLQAGIADGHTAAELRADPAQWQRQVLSEDHRLFESLADDALVFTDTSFIEDVVFARRAGMALGPNLNAWLQGLRYKKVFYLERLDGYEQSAVRMESQAVAEQISEQVQRCYGEYGYELVMVPAVSVQERVALIEAHLAERADAQE